MYMSEKQKLFNEQNNGGPIIKQTTMGMRQREDKKQTNGECCEENN